MLKILVKKQVSEIFRNYLYDAKRNKARSKEATIMWFVFYALVMIGVLGGIFGTMAWNMRQIITLQMGWFYYVLMGLIGIFLGAFGSVFNTYATLYLAKDNDQLLALPITVRDLLLSRLVSVYLLGLMYSATVTIPAVVIYEITDGFHLVTLLGGIIWLIVISMIVMVLSCLLGYVVARISTKMKHKNITTVFLSLIFIGLYYFFYFKASDILSEIISNISLYGNSVQKKAYLLYMLGRIGEGDWLAILMYVLGSVIAMAIIWYVMSRSFIKIATSTGVTSHITYKAKKSKQKSLFGAMLGKELGRFTGSASYMLNCGLGLILLPGMGIFLLIRGEIILSTIRAVFTDMDAITSILIIGMAGMAASMNDLVAPSVSLEGKSLWISKSLPVPTLTILKAKMALQMILSGTTVLFFVICACFALRLYAIEAVFVLMISCLLVVLTTVFGLFMGLNNVNLNWTNEIYPIKQSMSVAITLFGGWLYSVAMVLPYMLFAWPLGKISYLSIVTIVTGILCVLLWIWIKGAGVRKFEEL